MHDNPGPDGELRGVKLAFLDALEQGEAPADWLRRYPQHAATLTDLALAATTPATDLPASAVARAAALARAALHAQATVSPQSAIRNPQSAEPALGERVKALGLNMRDVAARVRLTSEILFKLDRRIIPVDTVPARLLNELGAVLGCTADALRAGLGGAGPQTAGAMYHAKQAPAVGQQAFADAVRASLNLSAEDRAYWLDQA
jgi:hypothetical protein